MLYFLSVVIAMVSGFVEAFPPDARREVGLALVVPFCLPLVSSLSVSSFLPLRLPTESAMHAPVWLHASIVLFLILSSFILTMTKVAMVVAQRLGEGDVEEGGTEYLSFSHLLAGVRSSLALILVMAGVYCGFYLRVPFSEFARGVLDHQTIGERVVFWLMWLVLSATIVVFGDFVPRRVALQYPCQVYRLTIPVARFVTRVLGPFLRLANAVANVVLGKSTSSFQETTVTVTEEEVRSMLERAKESGVIHPAEQQILTKVFRFGSRYVSSLMTPRNDIVWLDCEEPIKELWETARRSGFSHFPVMRGSIDDIVGVVSIGDLAEQYAAGGGRLDVSLCREVYQVPATTQALSVLQRFQEDKHRFALVIDEYGGIDGLITTHDLMEALVGEIGDGELSAESTVVKREDGSFLVDASVDLEDMMDRIGVRLPVERERKGFYSLGGLIMERLGHVPQTGEHFRYGGVYFEVVDMDGYRIDKVLVRPLPQGALVVAPTTGARRNGAGDTSSGKSDPAKKPLKRAMV